MERVPLNPTPLEQAFLPSSRNRVWQGTMASSLAGAAAAYVSCFAQLSEVPTSLKALQVHSYSAPKHTPPSDLGFLPFPELICHPYDSVSFWAVSNQRSSLMECGYSSLDPRQPFSPASLSREQQILAQWPAVYFS